MARPTMTFLGQAGFVFTATGNTTLGVDLYLSDCVEHSPDGFKRLCPKMADPDTLNLDFVAATHEHLDHYDVDAMPRLMANGRTVLVAAEDCRKHAAGFDGARTVFLREGDVHQAREFTITAVPCDHGDDAPQAIGLVIEFDGKRVYIAGDTHFRPDFVEGIAKLGPFDVMIVPINGQFGNCDELQAARLCAMHGPRLSVPCHYWMFAEHHGDPGTFAEALKSLAPEREALLMCPGETREL